MSSPGSSGQVPEIGVAERQSIPKDDKHIPFLRGTTINPSTIEGSPRVNEVVTEPNPQERSSGQGLSKEYRQEQNTFLKTELKEPKDSEKINVVSDETLISWESLKPRILEHLKKRADDKSLETLLETISVEHRPDGFCFICSNKAQHALLQEKLPGLLELLNHLAPETGIKLTTTVKEVPAALTKPKPAKPAEIREAMAEKNPDLLKFIQQLNLKLD